MPAAASKQATPKKKVLTIFLLQQCRLPPGADSMVIDPERGVFVSVEHSSTGGHLPAASKNGEKRIIQEASSDSCKTRGGAGWCPRPARNQQTSRALPDVPCFPHKKRLSFAVEKNPRKIAAGICVAHHHSVMCGGLIIRPGGARAAHAHIPIAAITPAPTQKAKYMCSLSLSRPWIAPRLNSSFMKTMIVMYRSIPPVSPLKAPCRGDRAVVGRKEELANELAEGVVVSG